jgi:hypothetical protein
VKAERKIFLGFNKITDRSGLPEHSGVEQIMYEQGMNPGMQRQEMLMMEMWDC